MKPCHENGKSVRQETLLSAKQRKVNNYGVIYNWFESNAITFVIKPLDCLQGSIL